jgi:hypothetical protein
MCIGSRIFEFGWRGRMCIGCDGCLRLRKWQQVLPGGV